MRQFGKMLRFYEELHENMKKRPVFITGCTEDRAELHREYFNAIGVPVNITPVFDSSRFPKFIYDKNRRIVGQEKYKPKLTGYEIKIAENRYEL